MMKRLQAHALAIALLSGFAHAAVIDETATMAPGGAPGAAAPGAAGHLNTPMRTAVSLNTIQKAFDSSDPRANVENFTYSPREIYKLRLREFMSATVALPKGEMIVGWQLPDKTNFTFTPHGGKKKVGDKPDPSGLDAYFTVEPKYAGADTSLVVFGGSGRIYPFYLRVDSVKSEHMPVFVAYVRDAAEQAILEAASATLAPAKDDAAATSAPSAPGAKPAKPMTGEEAAAEAEYLRSLPNVDPTKIRLDGYRVAGGDKDLVPVKIFDDGYWTYFKLSEEKNLDRAKAVAIYRVVDGYDTPAITRVEGGTIIAEGLSKGWTLRRGEAHLCVRAK